MNRVHGSWIEPARADQIPQILDNALALSTRPVLAWAGIKGPGNKTVHVKGRGGQTTTLEWNSETFSSDLEQLARAWGLADQQGAESSGGGASLDPADIYARRQESVEAAKETVGTKAQQAAQPAADGLPDAESVYAHRKVQASGGDES